MVSQLRKRDGSLERKTSRFATLRLPYRGRTLGAGLAHSWARRGIPTSSHAEEINKR